jgi:hypothetical protein
MKTITIANTSIPIKFGMYRVRYISKGEEAKT